MDICESSVLGPVPNTPAARQIRQATVFFSGPYDDVLVKAIPLQVQEAEGVHEISKYPKIIAGDHLRMKLTRSNV
jgi:hypothetical protein